MMTAFVRMAALLLMLVAASPLSWAATLPKDIMLVFDNSGSMRHSDPHRLAKKAITNFIDGLPADTHFGVLIFDKAINLAQPLTALDAAGKKAVSESLKAINYRGQLTDSPSAMERAIYELRVNGRKDAQKIVVFMTDGIVDVGNRAESEDKAVWLREEVADEAAKNKIRIYAIAFTNDADYQLIQSLATKTNGEYYRALKAEDLSGAFAHVANAIEKLQAPTPPAPKPEAKQTQAAPTPAATSTPAAPETTTPATPTTTPAPEAAPTTQEAPAASPSETPATPAQPAPAQPAAPTPAASQSAPAATPSQSAAGEKASAEQAAEAFEKATGISKEELEKLPQGQAIIVRPEHENKGMGMVIIAVGGILILLVIVGLFVFLKKRGSKTKAAPVSAGSLEIPDEEPYVPRAYLRDLHGNTDLSEHELGTKPAMLGRVPGGDAEHVHYIVVNQPTIGRRHALIEYKDFSFWIVDQASVNGTFVNGQRVTGEQRLKHGDKIRLHKYDFEFVMPEVADAGKTVFAGASDKTVLAEATLMQAAPVVPVAPESPTPTPDAQVDEEEEEAFDVTGGFDAGVLPPAAAGIEAFAETEEQPQAEPSSTPELGSVDDFLDSGSMEFGDVPVSGAAPEASSEPTPESPGEELAFDLSADEASAPAEQEEAPAAAKESEEIHDRETVVLGPEESPASAEEHETPVDEGEEFHDRETVVLGPEAAPTTPEEPPKASSAPPSSEAEDLSLDSFISTTVLEASQFEGGTAQPETKIGSEDPTIMPGDIGASEPTPTAKPAAEGSSSEDDVSLDDFLDDAAMMSSGIRGPDSDKTVVLSDDDNDRTLMPSQVDQQKPKPEPKEEDEDTHMGDTTVFNADDVTLPPKKR